MTSGSRYCVQDAGIAFKVFVLGTGVIEFALVFVDLEHPNAGGWLVCVVCSLLNSVHSGYYQA